MLAETEFDGRKRFEVADIIRMYGEKYRGEHTLTHKQELVMAAIEHCRSSALGYHVDACGNCGHIESSYNSCRDRHCPKCQGIARRKWIESRLKDLLPVPYYHAVFTLPDSIFPMCLFNQGLIYNLLFDSASETLLTFGWDEKWLGGQTGFFGVLHTWGQTMWLHPHVHFIVAGGGINDEGKWISGKYREKFLFPVRALSRVFRGKFIEGLKEAYCRGELRFPGELAGLESTWSFGGWIEDLRSHEWVVFTRPPFGSPEEVLNYVGRYTHRVAISNHRILAIDKDQVVFSYKDYADKNKIKQMTLNAEEFIRRFLWHVLPSGFHKIRHYGFLANGMKAKLRGILKALNSGQETPVDSTEQVAAEYSGGIICPVCRRERLCPIAIVTRSGELVVRNTAWFVALVKDKLLQKTPEISLSFN